MAKTEVMAGLPVSPMRLFWSSRSPFVRKVLIAAHELGVADQLTLVPTLVSPLVIDPALAQLHPVSQLPTLVLQDGTPIFDSAVICDYLDRIAGGALIPQRFPERLTALTRQALADGILEKAVLWWDELRRPETHRSSERLGNFHRRISNALDRFERASASENWDVYDIGSITLTSAVAYLDFRFGSEDWWTTRSSLRARYRTWEERPSVKATTLHN